MAVPNPLAALNMISPSLIGYTGGYGKAMQALGGSMDSIGQTKLDLAKQIKDNEYKNAQLTLLQNADVRAGDKVKYDTEKDIQKENNTLNATRFMAKQINLPLGTELNGQTDPEIYAQNSSILAGLGLDGIKAMKPEKQTYKSTDKGLIYNENNPNDRFDLRTGEDKGAGFGGKGVTHVDTIKNGKVMRTFINPETGETKSIMIGGTPTGIAGMAYGDALQDNNTYQRPTITNTVNQDIGGVNIMAKGGMPIRLDSNPIIAAEQKKWALPIEGGGLYVPRDMVSKYQKQFPQKLPTKLMPPPPVVKLNR